MLIPKPDKIDRPKKDWDYLDGLLQNNFQNSYHEKPMLTILVEEYEMTAHEIKEEAERNGYKVTLHDDNQVVRFEWF